MNPSTESIVGHSTATPCITGYFDGLADGCAGGWVYSTTEPNTRLTVEIVCDDDEVVARGPADQFRGDLLAAGIGDGCYFFALPVSYELLDGRTHDLSAREAETGTLIDGGPHVFGPAVKTHPFDVLARREGVRLLEELLAQSVAPAPQSHELILAYRRACLLQETGQFAAARDAYADLLTLLGEHPLIHCKIGETYLLEGAYAQALEAYRTAAAADGCFPWAHSGIGHARRLLGQSIEAEDAYRLALGLHPDNAALQTWLAQVEQQSIPLRVDALVTRGEIDAAVALLKQRMLENPDDVAIADQLGQILLQQSPPTYDVSLPGLGELPEFEKARRLLELVLADAEALLSERG